MYLHPRASGYTDDRIADALPAAHTSARAASMCARVCARAIGLTHRRRHMRARSVGVDRGWLGSQAFQGASVFNQLLAAWNVARVASLTGAFDSTALADCIKGAIYRLWGATLRAAYPGFSSMCGASCSLTCLTDANIGTAATAWITSPSTAATTYGPITDWDTSAVTSMAELFYPSSTAQPTFNGDISKWNVASVSNMYRVRLASVCAASSLSHVLSLS
jgi:hypothetical protein